MYNIMSPVMDVGRGVNFANQVAGRQPTRESTTPCRATTAALGSVAAGRP